MTYPGLSLEGRVALVTGSARGSAERLPSAWPKQVRMSRSRIYRTSWMEQGRCSARSKTRVVKAALMHWM